MPGRVSRLYCTLLRSVEQALRRPSEDGNAVVVGAEGEDVFPGVAGVGREMGVVSGLDGAVEDVDDVVVLL